MSNVKADSYRPIMDVAIGKKLFFSERGCFTELAQELIFKH